VETYKVVQNAHCFFGFGQAFSDYPIAQVHQAGSI